MIHSICKYLYFLSSELIKDMIFKLKKSSYVFSPVFIIGCGRSGTTILGDSLSQHPEIKYLNERRDLWHKSYPEFDIWNKDAQGSKLYADEKDIEVSKNSILKHLLFREQVLSESKVLVEKLPVNSFRLNFLKSTFPNARYIYLTRNGLEVSRSIEEAIDSGNWFRRHDILKSHAIDSDKNRGIWEWKLSIQHSDSFFKQENGDSFIHFSYKDFMDNPSKIIQDMFSFLDLDYSESLVDQICKNIKRANPEIKKATDEDLYLIGGEILKETIENNYSPS